MKVDLTAHGYHTRRPEQLALEALLSRPRNGVRALLLEGAPGTGKTFLAECLAKAIDAEYAYMLCHNWLSDEELFIGVDVGAVSESDATHRCVESARSAAASHLSLPLGMLPRRAVITVA